MGDLNDLASKMVEYGVRVETNASRIHQKAGVAVVEAVAKTTPVDTGDAITNWQLSSGSPADNVRKAFFPGNFGSTHEDNIRATIEDAKEKSKEHSAGQTIFVTNNLDYIRELNDGYSPQAQPGYVEEAVEGVRQLISDTIGIRILDPVESGPGQRPLPDILDDQSFVDDSDIPF